ncbi:MAG TPA: hypothetical protein VKC61_21240 [Pyrinomonadaceae bacterium]|nr:hypothetical protein [Pyrinomonadaceae bacterium]
MTSKSEVPLSQLKQMAEIMRHSSDGKQQVAVDPVNDHSLTLAAKQKIAESEAFFKQWEARDLFLTPKGPQPRKQYEIILLKTLDFDRSHQELKVKLESELASRITYLKYELLPTKIPEEAIIDMTSCEMVEDVFFTIEELMIFWGYSQL